MDQTKYLICFFAIILLLSVVSASSNETVIFCGGDDQLLIPCSYESESIIGIYQEENLGGYTPSIEDFNYFDVSIGDICSFNYWRRKRFYDYSLKELSICTNGYIKKFGDYIWKDKGVAGFVFLVIVFLSFFIFIYFKRRNRNKKENEKAKDLYISRGEIGINRR